MAELHRYLIEARTNPSFHVQDLVGPLPPPHHKDFTDLGQLKKQLAATILPNKWLTELDNKLQNQNQMKSKCGSREGAGILLGVTHGLPTRPPLPLLGRELHAGFVQEPGCMAKREENTKMNHEILG